MCRRSETSGTSPSSAELAESETAETLTLRATDYSLCGARTRKVKGGSSAGSLTRVTTAEAER
jgi:hypothetical protein